MKNRKKLYAVAAGLCVMIAGALFLCGRSEAGLGSGGVVLHRNEGADGGAPDTGDTSAAVTESRSDAPDDRAFVHVCGAVAAPGVYELPAGSRLEGAISAAGGFSEDADRDYYNLAQIAEDGEQIRVPAKSGSAGYTENGSYDDGLVDINTASATELASLPGIGAVKACAIIEYRDKNGRFGSIEDIMNVPGIKESLFSKIKGKIKTGG